MRRKNGFAGRRRSCVAMLFLLIAAVAVFTGCMGKTAEELKREITDNCRERVEKWLAENDPDAIWPGYSTVKIYEETNESGYKETRVMNVATGKYRRSDGEEVSFLYNDDTMELYVSSLPKKSVEEFANFLTIIDGVTLTGIRAGRETFIPVSYTEPPGGRKEAEPYYIVGENEFAGKLLLPYLDGRNAYDISVPQPTFSDMDKYTYEENRDAFFRQEEIKLYLQSKWCCQLMPEITLTDSDFLSREKELISWLHRYNLCGAIVLDKNGESWTIVRSNVLSAANESGTQEDKVWLEHYTVSKGADPEQAADSADVRYFLAEMTARKIKVQLNDQGVCEVRFDEPGESWDGKTIPTEY